MKYLVHRKTKEHKVLHRHTEYATCDWHIVQADDDGWIAWDCEADLECPISEDQPYHARLRSGSIVDDVVRWGCYNNYGDVLAYRPIIAEKVQEPEPIPAPHLWTSVTPDLLDALKLAHEHAQQIPDLEAELREVLAGMGYDLVARSPFVNQCCGNPAQCWEPCGELGKSEEHVAVAEPEPAVETPQDNKYAAELYLSATAQENNK